jgi:hypothetical protein
MIRIVLAVVFVGGSVMAACSPACRALVKQTYKQFGGWTEAARKGDPAGYVEYVRGQLRQDLADMRDSSAQLQTEQERLESLLETRQRQFTDATRLLDSFRSAWQAGTFPVTVLGRSYTSEQLQTQVAMLLEEQSACESGVQRIREAQQAAAERIRELTVQLSNTSTSLSLLDTQKELLISERLQTSGDALVAGVDALLEGNREVLSGGPVRPLEDLVTAEQSRGSASPQSLARVMEYLQNGLPGTGDANLVRSASTR